MCIVVWSKLWNQGRIYFFYLRVWHPRLRVTIVRPVAVAEGPCWREGCGSIPRPRPGCRRSRGRVAPAPQRIRRACLGPVAPTPRDSPPPAPCARYAARPIAWRVSFRGIPATPNNTYTHPKTSWPDLKFTISVSLYYTTIQPFLFSSPYTSYFIPAANMQRIHPYTHTHT